MTRDVAASAHSKFLPDGTARHFPGNTVISPVSSRSADAHLLMRTTEHLRDAFALDFVLLPPTSWHMTVFELLCDKVRDPARWSRFLAPDVSLAETDRFFAAQVPTVVEPEQLVMRSRGVAVGDDTAELVLEPDDPETASELHRYREELSAATGVRFPGHDDYRFHITLAYRLRQPTSRTQQQIDTAVALAHAELRDARFRFGRPALTYFADMTEFVVGARRDVSK